MDTITENPLASLATLRAPSPDDIMQPVETQASFALTMTVTNADERALAVDEIRMMQAKLKELDGKRRGITDSLNAVVKSINALFKPATDRLTFAIDALKGAVLTYDEEQARLERKRREAAERAAREEAARLAAEAAELARIAEEQARDLAKQADDQADAGNVESATATAMAADIKRQAAQAEVIAAQAQAGSAIASAAISRPAAKSAGGAGSRTKWVGEVTDKAALIRHIAQHPELIELLDVNQGAVDRMAGALKSAMNIPGITPREKATLVVRRA